MTVETSGGDRETANARNWDYFRQRFQRNRGLRIDYVLGSPSFAERVTGAFIDVEGRNPDLGEGAPSDHAAVVVDLAD